MGRCRTRNLGVRIKENLTSVVDRNGFEVYPWWRDNVRSGRAILEERLRWPSTWCEGVSDDHPQIVKSGDEILIVRDTGGWSAHATLDQ